MSIDYDLLREILKRTTPGPWTVEDDGYDIIAVSYTHLTLPTTPYV